MPIKYIWRPLGLCAVAAAVWLTGAVTVGAAPATTQDARSALAAGALAQGKLVVENDRDRGRGELERRQDRRDRKQDQLERREQRKADKYDREYDRRDDHRSGHRRDRYEQRRDDHRYHDGDRRDSRRDHYRDRDRRHDRRTLLPESSLLNRI